jgi:GMP synthase-like glutamine amidotransferase
MTRVVVIRHHDIDSAGFIADAFEARGASLAVHLFPGEARLPARDGVDHVVVLGAVNSVNDPDPWIAEELAWLRAADAAGVPVLGICFGAQALCAALGGRVEAMGRHEIGWVLVDSLDHDVIPAGPWLEFHNDRCLLPATAAMRAAKYVAGVDCRCPWRGLSCPLPRCAAGWPWPALAIRRPVAWATCHYRGSVALWSACRCLTAYRYRVITGNPLRF